MLEALEEVLGVSSAGATSEVAAALALAMQGGGV